MPLFYRLSWAFVALGLITAAVIALDVLRHPQRVRIMNVVWPVTGLYFPLVGLWLYRMLGTPRPADHSSGDGQSMWDSTFLCTAFCGSGCVVGDVIGAPLVFLAGLVLLGSGLLAEYAVEFMIAYALGIAFEVVAIRELRRGVPAIRALFDAIKADTLSVITFEIVVFGWTALIFFLVLHSQPRPDSILFWFTMQSAIFLGFVASYPLNWLLVKSGIKHRI